MFPAGKSIVSDLGLASAAMIAERSEIFPEASFPVLRFTATVSANVFTLNVESTTRSSSPSSLGLSRRTRALSFRLRKFNMLHPFRKMSAHHGRNPKFGRYQIRAAPATYRSRSVRSPERPANAHRSLPAYLPVPRARQHRPSQCPVASNSPIKLRKSARSRTESNSLLFANRSLSLNPAAKAW